MVFLLSSLRKAPISLFYLQSVAGCQAPTNDGGCFERRDLGRAGGGTQEKHSEMGACLWSSDLLDGREELWSRKVCGSVDGSISTH